MTERIYYTNATQIEFDAVVTRVEPREGLTVVVLDRTAFYPTSGGQPHDTGKLADGTVVEVTQLADGDIGHVLDGSVSVGQAVRGHVDWSRRFDHMQQHSGQHVLSAACDHLHTARTASFHLGSASSTIDLDVELSAQAIAAAGAEANRIVWENRPVTVRWADADEGASGPLRKESARTGVLRVVDVEGFDLSACGGTHVSHTGSIGIIAISSWERFKGGVRLSFVCGQRVQREFRLQREALAGSVRLLSVLPSELPEAIARLQAENKDRSRSLRALRERMSAYEAEALASAAVRVGRVAVVVESLAARDAVDLKRLATELTRKPDHVVALLSDASPALVVFACSENVSFDAAAALRQLTDRFGGRGGGKPSLAQGGGLVGEKAELLDWARRALETAR